MTLRRVMLPHETPYEALIRRIAASTHERSTLVVEVRMSAKRLREFVEAAGGDLDHLHVLDATGFGEAASPGDDHVTNVAGPHLLELIAVRAKKIAMHKAERRVVVIVDDVLTFSRFNTVAALIETIQLARNLHDDSNNQEFVMHPDAPEELRERMADALDEHIVIGADGHET